MGRWGGACFGGRLRRWFELRDEQLADLVQDLARFRLLHQETQAKGRGFGCVARRRRRKGAVPAASEVIQHTTPIGPARRGGGAGTCPAASPSALLSRCCRRSRSATTCTNKEVACPISTG